jgi:hypothetical protein
VAGQAVVDGRVLPCQPDQLPDLVGLPDRVVAADHDATVVGSEQGRLDADRRRLAGAVGAEQAQDRALGHLEVDAGQRGGGTEPFDQALGLDCVAHAATMAAAADRPRTAP